MKKLAETLRARAAAGEDFAKLQDEAIAASEFKSKPPTRLGKVRRTSLPPDQAADFRPEAGRDLAADHQSQRILWCTRWEKKTRCRWTKCGTKSFPRSSRSACRNAMQAIQQSATPQLNEKYFADATADGPPGMRPARVPVKPAVKAPESGPK